MKITCKTCRRLGQSICGKVNCATRRKAYPPGAHGKRYRRISEYGRQLAEKQKLRLLYGLREKQFKNYFNKASGKGGVVGHSLLSLLETRLDNIVFRLGFASTRRKARQLVSHGHFTVNKRKVTIPSYAPKVGDVVSIKNESKSKKSFEDLALVLKNYQTPTWLKLNKDNLEGTVVSLPGEDVLGEVPVEIAQIVEHYSR